MATEIRSLAGGPFANVLELIPQRIKDERGYFTETYSKGLLEERGIPNNFVQDNESFSNKAGTIRGLHFQIGPSAQIKLVRVLKGAIFDVAVDIRKGSPTFGKHVTCKLTAELGNQLYVPVGFAHGFCTLEPETLVTYKVSSHYSKEHDKGLLWSDPALSIAWPLRNLEVILSEKDRKHPLLAQLPHHFRINDESNN